MNQVAFPGVLVVLGQSVSALAIALGSRWAEEAIAVLGLVHRLGLDVQYEHCTLHIASQPFDCDSAGYAFLVTGKCVPVTA